MSYDIMIRTAKLVIVVCLVSVNALSIEKVSERSNVTKRNTGDFYPDWVPFKNKHGEELGEFLPVAKAKPKKRLAPPVNFILKTVADPEGEEYIDKGQSDSDNDDYYEKKDWSNVNQQSDTVNAGLQLNHTDISEIDGVVDIITKGKPNIILSVLQNNKNHSIIPNVDQSIEVIADKTKQENEKKDSSGQESREEKESTEQKEIREENKSEEPTEKLESKENTELPKTEDQQQEREGDEAEEDETNTDTKNSGLTEEEKRANDEKKARILNEVDELKTRHAEEQKLISERAKGEELYKEEQERNKLKHSPPENDKYSRRFGSRKEPDYDEYEEKEETVRQKYKPFKIRQSEISSQQKDTISSKHEEPGKLSVFKNPRLYVAYDDDLTDEVTTTKKPITPSRTKSTRFSSRYITTTPASVEEDNVRISLVPQDSDGKDGEPTLYFPKLKKNKRRRKQKTTTPEPDSYVAETVEEVASKGLITVPDFATAIGVGTSTSSATSATGTGTTAGDTVSTNSDAVTDAVAASTHAKGEEKKHDNYHNEKGGARQYHADHSEEHEEHGKKAYQGVHEDSKTAKGHHDKESHHGKYSDHGGHDKLHEHESGHYGDHKHEEHGKKQAKYEESGKHSKGHSTKGSHDIHKKEEYEKKVEFFEEDGDSAEEEKHGGYHDEKSHKQGGHFKKGGIDAGHHQHHKGNSGDFAKGGHAHGHKGHSSAAGHEGHAKHGHGKFDKGEKESGRKWIYHHGHPAKTANLVVIDRRADQLYHGPQYYG